MELLLASSVVQSFFLVPRSQTSSVFICFLMRELTIHTRTKQQNIPVNRKFGLSVKYLQSEFNLSGT
jgi:hypothetical protein